MPPLNDGGDFIKQVEAHDVEELEESKSPLKPIRIKHFDDRNKKLFEHLIAKVTKND